MKQLLLDGPALARYIGVKPETVRVWVHRGQLTPKGVGPHGLKLYDVDDAEVLATRPRSVAQRSKRASALS